MQPQPALQYMPAMVPIGPVAGGVPAQFPMFQYAPMPVMHAASPFVAGTAPLVYHAAPYAFSDGSIQPTVVAPLPVVINGAMYGFLPPGMHLAPMQPMADPTQLSATVTPEHDHHTHHQRAADAASDVSHHCRALLTESASDTSEEPHPERELSLPGVRIAASGAADDSTTFTTLLVGNHRKELREFLLAHYPAVHQYLEVMHFSHVNAAAIDRLGQQWRNKSIPVPGGAYATYYLWHRVNGKRDLCMKHNGRAKNGEPYERCTYGDSKCKFKHECVFCRSPDHGWFAVGKCAARVRLQDNLAELGLLPAEGTGAQPVADGDMTVILPVQAYRNTHAGARHYSAGLSQVYSTLVDQAAALLFGGEAVSAPLRR